MISLIECISPLVVSPYNLVLPPEAATARHVELSMMLGKIQALEQNLQMKWQWLSMFPICSQNCCFVAFAAAFIATCSFADGYMSKRLHVIPGDRSPTLTPSINRAHAWKDFLTTANNDVSVSSLVSDLLPPWSSDKTFPNGAVSSPATAFQTEDLLGLWCCAAGSSCHVCGDSQLQLAKDAGVPTVDIRLHKIIAYRCWWSIYEQRHWRVVLAGL